MNFIAEALTVMPDLAGLGSAGLMGAMWLWERKNSRLREQQLDEAHQRILNDRVQLEQIINLVRSNTEAITRLCETSNRLLEELVVPSQEGASARAACARELAHAHP